MRSILSLTLLAILMTSYITNAYTVHSNEDDDLFSEEGLGGTIACYSQDSEAGAWGVDDDIEIIGELPFLGFYNDNGIFQPKGYEGQDISEITYFKNLCNNAFAACKGACWAGGDAL